MTTSVSSLLSSQAGGQHPITVAPTAVNLPGRDSLEQLPSTPSRHFIFLASMGRSVHVLAE